MEVRREKAGSDEEKVYTATVIKPSLFHLLTVEFTTL